MMPLKSLRHLFSGRRNPQRLYWLTSDIALSGQPELADWSAIASSGVCCVVDLRFAAPDNSAIVEANGLIYLRMPIPDGEAPSDEELEFVTDWIVGKINEQGPVLLHCRQGRGRSAMVACATLVKLGLQLQESYRLVRLAHPDIALTGTQIEALERFANAQRRE